MREPSSKLGSVGRVQRIGLAVLLAALSAVGTLALIGSNAVSNDASRAAQTSTVSDLYQDARFYAASAVGLFDEYQLHHDRASAVAAQAAAAHFLTTLQRLPQQTGTNGQIDQLMRKMGRITALADRADALMRSGQRAAAARLDHRADAVAQSAIGDLSKQEEVAHRSSVGAIRHADHFASQLLWAAPIALSGLLGLAILITVVLRRDRRRIAEVAATDPLTGLPNRRSLIATLAATAGRGLGGPSSTERSVLLLDLDRFKEVNDGLGHHFGDALLQHVAQRLRGQCSSGDTVSRIGGDEFVILLPNTDEPTAESVARRIRRVVHSPYVIDGISVDLDVSIGIATSRPGTLDNPAALLRAADVAMYEAKTNGDGQAIYTHELGERIEKKIALIGQLRHALEYDEFVLQYQPQIRIDDGELVGVEALLRWQHPVRGLIGPGDFLPLIDADPVIDQITMTVLRKALGQARTWLEAGERIPISVNVATRNLLNLTFTQEVADLLEEFRIEPELLCIEVTETTVMHDSTRCARTLSGLHALGVHLSVDDYGTGYASMIYLKDLPLDELKIDRGFVTNMLEDLQHYILTSSVVELGHNLGLRVVAEGVETSAVLNALRATGCDVAQGFLYSRPLPADQILNWSLARRMPTSNPSIPEQRPEAEAAQDFVASRRNRR